MVMLEIFHTKRCGYCRGCISSSQCLKDENKKLNTSKPAYLDYTNEDNESNAKLLLEVAYECQMV